MAEITVTMQNFEEEVLNSSLPVMLDFWASWCGPCRMIAPAVEELAIEMEGKAKVGKVNVDEQPELAAKFGIMSIPTIMVFKNGAPVGTSVGLVDKEKLKSMLI